MSDNVLYRNETQAERFDRLTRQEQGWKQDYIATVLGCARSHVSQIRHGQALTEDNAKKLAKKLGLRKEYILCEDNFRTEEEFYQYTTGAEEMQAAIKYLESLGLILKPRNILRIYLWPVYKIINGYYDVDLEDFVKEQDIEDLKKKYDFALSEEEFKEVYQLDAWKESTLQKPEFCYLELSAPVPVSSSFEPLTNSNYSKDSASGCYPIAPKDNPFHTLLWVGAFFDAYYKGDLKQRIGVSKLQKFIKTLDLHTKISIENNLLDGEPGDMYMPLSAFNE